MTSHFENELRQALRPAEPPDGFAARVLAKLPAGSTAPARAPIIAFRAASHVTRWWPAALAASFIVGIIATLMTLEHHEQLAGLRARQQVMEALRVTSDKLDLAYRVVRNASAVETNREEQR